MDARPSRQKIINYLKRSDWMTVAELSKKVGITPMAVRQHLLALDRQGIVRNVVRKTGIGRPVFLYGLTERAESIFPKSYGKFINEIFSTIVEMEGHDMLDSIIKRRKEQLLIGKYNFIADFSDPRDKVSTLSEMLNQDGYMTEVEEQDGGYVLKEFNCPISEISVNYSEPCKYELELYRDLLGEGVQRQECLCDGGISCTYFVPTD
ncbi:MAG: ArsR family transcriptional regulator [Nitrospirota bacterium]|jgi:predicted ArsR family transcriptional regulator